MGACYVEGCEPTDDENVTYFPFPVKPTLRRKWRVALNSSCKLPAWGAVCSRHFKEDDTQRVRGKLRLRGRVVPTLRLKNPSKSRSATASPVRQEEQNDTEDKNAEDSIKEDGITDDGIKEDGINEDGIKEDGINEDGIKEDDMVTEEDRRDESDDGAEKCTIECAPSSILPSDSDGEMSSELHNDNDIEDIIANYHIKQDEALRQRLRADDGVVKDNGTDGGHGHGDRDGSAPGNGAKAAERVAPPAKSVTSQGDMAMTSQSLNDDVIELEDEVSTAPEYIEIAVENGAKSPCGGAGDCLMVLESVQVDIDPAALMFEHEQDDKNEDPISLLTSSDDDDVIIEEPHVDTVEVSDETDEDDVPLVKLVQSDRKSAKSDRKSAKSDKKSAESDISEGKIGSILWGNMYEYYCYKCKFVSTNRWEFNKHKRDHDKVLEMCAFCDYSTPSKGQFYRHMKKHKAEKRYKCPKCQYRARHHMSLVYHMKSHKDGFDETIILGKKKTRYAYRCTHCKVKKFKSNSKKEMLEHVKICEKLFDCKYCDYRTNRSHSLKIHVDRKHPEKLMSDDEDD